MTIIRDTGGVLRRWESRTLEEAVTNQLKPMDALLALRKIAGSLGLQRLVACVNKALPPEQAATRDPFTILSRNVASLYPKYRVDRTRALAAPPGVPLTDLRERFSSVAKRLFIADCLLVDRGYELIARTIAQAIDQPGAPEERFPYGTA
jgi:hypothetical protein